MNGNIEKVCIKSATLGFKGYIWRVVTPDNVEHVVNACSNYDAAEACGFKFGQCIVEELRLIPSTLFNRIDKLVSFT
jgi:hypothetical protein